jgi:hypothetical protein
LLFLEQLSEFIVINVKINAIPFSTWPCNHLVFIQAIALIYNVHPVIIGIPRQHLQQYYLWFRLFVVLLIKTTSYGYLQTIIK